MKEQWEKEIYLRGSDFDSLERLKPSAVLDLFQDVAGEHADHLGIGFGDMLEKGLLWVVARAKFELLGNARPYERVRVRTWPLPQGRAVFVRNYKICHADGTLLAQGCSEWALMDVVKRRLTAVADVYPLGDRFCTEEVFTQRLRRVPDFEAAGEGYPILPGYSSLDLNGHVNNARYAEFALDAATPAETEQIVGFQIDYRREVHRGMPLQVFAQRGEGTILVKGCSDSGEIAFACGMETAPFGQSAEE